MRVSTSEFQVPQLRHCPSQRENAAAQLWQTYWLAARELATD
jgi:hypothetical protein